jgi:hypothetical protein
MRTRENHGTARRTGQQAGAVALAGLALLAVGAGSPAQAADRPGPRDGAPTKAAPQKPQPKPEQDLTAPQRPTLGEATAVAGGEVRVDVQAESGSALVVREGAEVVASASALGSTQTLSWKSETGPHTFLVVATDAAGNVSDPAPITLGVDATPPAAKDFVVVPGTDRDSRTRWSVTTDPGTAYELVVDGTTVQEGTTEGRGVEEHLALADGNHRVELALRDEIGNLRTLTKDVAVEIPALWVVAKDVSRTNDTERTFKVAAAPGTRGFLRIPGGASTKFELPEGRAEVTVEVEEGSYEAPVVTVADTLDRKGNLELAPFDVDLTAPALLLEATPGAGERGMLSARITAGQGDDVTWRLVDDRGVPAMSGEFVADGTAQLLEREVGEGSYELEVTATDAKGNSADERLETSIAAPPIVNPDVAPALLITLVLWVLVGLAFYLRRRTRRLTELAGVAAQGRTIRTKRGLLRAQHAQAVAEHAEQLAASAEENVAWEQRGAELAQLLAIARGGSVQPTDAFEVGAQERVLCTLPATLVELRDQDGTAVPVEVEDGRLMVSRDRVVFSGSETREWPLGEVEQLRHLGQSCTMLAVADEETTSGVAYGDDLVRLYLELAIAERDGDSRSVRLMLEQGVRSHELRRPQPPTPVAPAPAFGRRGRHSRAHAAEQVTVAEQINNGIAARLTSQPAAAPVVPAPVMVAQHGEPAEEQVTKELALQS